MFDSVPAYSAVLARCVLNTAGEGVDTHMLLRDAGLPQSVLTTEHGMVSSRAYLRLWERAEFRQDAPEVGLRIASTYRIGRFGIFDYLFSTAATVAEGLAAVRRSGALMATTNHHYSSAWDTSDSEHTMVLEMIDGDGRGADLTIQAAYASTLARIRHASGASITPTRITLRQKPPRAMGAFVDAFGTAAIDFDAPFDSVTLRAGDLALPLRTADPVLAEIVRGHAESLSAPMLDKPSWPEQVQRALREMLGGDDVSLNAVARCLTVSPRTLQRHLAESGTTWRRELDHARQTVARQAAETTTKSSLARRLGYSDVRALRRAARRWDSGTVEQQAS
ncbi:AraC family transcriptional regulator ligand-binding domain-containing protein [Nocardia sp. CA-151230]|uniref:AraC family transcriptional regulator ligand-binding domain-containing protein n=1 Tax=Nocardia sp. CA-151230 TaxID=3239982 RepID=UPI003D92F3D3